MPCLSSLTYKPDRQSGGDHQLHRDESSQTCKHKNIKRRSTQPQWAFGCYLYPPCHQLPLLTLIPGRNFLSGCCPKQGHYLQLLFTSKTHERAHALDCGLTLPQTCLMSHYLAYRRYQRTSRWERNTHFSSPPRIMPPFSQVKL